MLSKESNEILCRVVGERPMGALFRRFWLPALLSSEVARADCDPVRLKVLGEDLVAFRDTAGRLGVVQGYCPHRLAPLFFGRNEQGGLRCPYHGWKFSTEGKCMEMPGVANSDSASVRKLADIVGYPVREAAGVVWVYMGPADRIPPFPELEYTQLPEGHVHASRWLQRSNWLQGLEGELDSAHISWLHKEFKAAALLNTGADLASDGTPVLTVRETDYGLTYGALRSTHDGTRFWRQTHWLAPMFSLLPLSPGRFTGGGGRAWVPVDDENTTTFSFWFNSDGPLSAQTLTMLESGAVFPPRLERKGFETANGYVIDTFLPVANKSNDYLVDRAVQKAATFTGIWGANEQDRALQESMYSGTDGRGGIVDRSRERLMASDIAIVTARRRLLSMVRELQEGTGPACLAAGSLYAVRALSKLSAIEDFDEFLREYRDEMRVPARQPSAE